MRAAFDAGWDGALEEAITILETAEFKDTGLEWAIEAIKEYRRVSAG